MNDRRTLQPVLVLAAQLKHAEGRFEHNCLEDELVVDFHHHARLVGHLKVPDKKRREFPPFFFLFNNLACALANW